MSKLNPHRKVVFKMSTVSCGSLLLLLKFAQKYIRAFEPEYSDRVDSFISHVQYALDNSDGEHQICVDVKLKH